ncbi:MAG TPA: phosphoglycerate dehydrogenase, partial [Chloroflexi bacterium]|nr:phosphoglycerate dehydrogenase [Chloroflexota bacterium]
DGLSKKALPILEEVAQVDDRGGIGAEELAQVIGEYDAAIVRGRTKMRANILEAADKLKVIGRAGVGVDNIDLSAAQQKGITVVNAPTASTLAVAELTIGMMFAVARFIPRADAGMKAGQWLKKQLKGTELNGKTLGVIGLGRIGTAVAERAAALGMQIVGYDAFDAAREAFAAKGFSVVDTLDALYPQVDYITLHIPLTPQTRNLLDGQAFGKMKPGVRLICAARGGVIDETALLGALESGQVAGAALDVFAEEPPGLTALVSHPNVVATPHIGAQTKEAQDRAAVDIATEVVAALKGEPLRWKVI